ncbi:hypothetical protein PITC_055080 [Penicillium italicum]|uniref:Uncharacterized protein n=1 Tax=Penicillium italicum TaxID=40296 RepID=A0A0A2LG93_PENIT|nr:hypothetical protein PITC_055080 [Penicillium italicum]
MILRNHQSQSLRASSTPNFVSRLEYPGAFPFHERCWQLMTRILDVDVIKRNLDLFLRAIFKPDYLMFLGTGSHSIIVSPEVRALLGLSSPFATKASILEPPFHPTTQTSCATNYGDPYPITRDVLSTDPLNESYIEDVIAKYTAKYTKQREKGFTSTSQPLIPTYEMSRRS